jgi:putative Holliday junction resolvase
LRRIFIIRALSRNELQDTTSSDNSNTRRPSGNRSGRLLALDLGEKRVGVAVSDELWITVRPLPFIRRTSWKQLLVAVADLLQSFDAQALVIGLPLNLDGTEGLAAVEARRLARNFELSLKVPVHMQDERLTSREAEATLREAGRSNDELRQFVDSEAAAIILRDFIAKPYDL